MIIEYKTTIVFTTAFTNFEIMTSKSKVYFFFENTGITLKNRYRLKGFIETLFKNENKNLQTINYIFCSDNRLLNINQSYLGHDYYTDILTFDLSENSAAISGEVYISMDRVRDNARITGVTITSELHRVIFHGALHLCGYKDKSAQDEAKMRKKEDLYLTKYFHMVSRKTVSG
jgi:rRNA maturation RNase YbeY